jgi:hypothetical protein
MVSAISAAKQAWRAVAHAGHAIQPQQSAAVVRCERTAIGADDHVARIRPLGAGIDPRGVFALFGAAVQLERRKRIGAAA